MAADGAAGRAGRVEKHAIERGARVEPAPVGFDQIGLEAEPREVPAHQFQALGGAVQRRDKGARGNQLQGLAARGRAKIEDSLAPGCGQQPGRQGRGGVLYPPGAGGKARQLLDPAAGPPPEPAGWKNIGIEPLRPGAGLHRIPQGEVERRLGEVGAGDGPGGLGAVGLGADIAEPARHVDPRCVEVRQQVRAVARHAPEHRIDKPPKPAPGHLCRKAHRSVDRGMWGCLQDQHLGDA